LFIFGLPLVATKKALGRNPRCAEKRPNAFLQLAVALSFESDGFWPEDAPEPPIRGTQDNIRSHAVKQESITNVDKTRTLAMPIPKASLDPHTS
jgi:hypothetical protein